MNRSNIIIIGAGMAGLTAAAYLARAGLPVQVFEQHSSPGGYVSSFKRRDYVFNSGPNSFGSNGIIFPILKELGLDKKVAFLRSNHQISWGSHDISLSDPAQTCRELMEIFPHESKALRRYFRWVAIGAAGFRDSLQGGMMFSRGIFKTMVGLVFKRPLFFWASWLAGRHTNRSLHDHYFKEPHLKQSLNQLGFPVMTGQATLGMWTSYYYDTWAPVGGMQAFSNCLADLISENGGEIHLGKQVRRIKIENGNAEGVELETGEFVPAELVISAGDLRRTCFELIGRDRISRSMADKLEKASPSESIFTVYLGLKAGPELSDTLIRFKANHIFFTCSDGNYIRLDLISKDDASLAPTGDQTLLISALSPFDEWEPLKDQRHSYLERKASYAEMLISRAEEILPGLRGHIDTLEAASPLTYEDYTSNWRGSTSGWNWNPNKSPQFKFEEELPIKNLYTIGHYVHNPGGVPTAMITAWYVARDIISKS